MKPEELERALDQALGAPPATPDAALDALAAAARAAQAEPVRRWSRTAALTAGAALATGVLAASLMTSHTSQHDSAAMRWGLGAALLACCALGAVAVRPGPLRARHLAAAAGALTLLVLPLLGSGFVPQRTGLGAGCGLVSLTVAALPFAVGAWALGTFAATALRGALVGLAAGAASTLALHFHCASGDALHLGLFHAGPWAVLAALGAAAAVLRRPSTYAP